VRFFASRLKYLRTVRVTLVSDETVETLVRTLADHLDSWGGAPLLCVFDRPKTVALKWKPVSPIRRPRLSGRRCPPDGSPAGF